MSQQPFFINPTRLGIMVEFMKKQGIRKPLGQVFCEDYEILDHDIRHQSDDKKAAELILKRFKSGVEDHAAIAQR